MGRLVVSPEADADLEAIGAFVAERDGKLRAAAAVERIQKTMHNLAFMPGMGRSREYLGKRRRAFPASPWTIVYLPLPEGDGILVQRILHGRRDLAAIFRLR